MNVDYKAIADADPGGDLTLAFETMAAATETRGRGAYRITQLEVANQVGMAIATTFRAGLDRAVVEGACPAWVVSALDVGGIDINHPDTVGSMNALVGSGYLLQDDVTAIIGMGSEIVVTWPRLKEGHLDDARTKRAKGKI